MVTRLKRDTLAYVVLGLLRHRARTGYDITTTVNRTVGYVWNASESQIYSVLKQLETSGLVETELIVQETRPNRRLARLTPPGEEAFERWLASPLPERFTKDEFLARLFFMGHGESEQREAFLEQHRVDVLRQRAYVEAAYEAFKDRPSRQPNVLEWQMLTVEYTLARLNADLEVTDRALRRYRNGADAATPIQQAAPSSAVSEEIENQGAATCNSGSGL
jgi:DNA-binding PadR family transcriptional regulator